MVLLLSLKVELGCRKNSESSRSHLLVGISVCKESLTKQLTGRRTRAADSPIKRTGTLWVGDLCGSETFDHVCPSAPPCPVLLSLIENR